MSYQDFETKKSLHINLTKETHTEIKICAFRHGLSMQEIFEELARQIVEGDSHILKILEDIQRRKRLRETRKFSQVDAESIFRVIKEDNPLDKK